MQRPLYPGLFLIAIALAAALYLRPTVGEELVGLIGARVDQGLPAFGDRALYAQSTMVPAGIPGSPAGQGSAPPFVPWPGIPAGEGSSASNSVPASGLSPTPPAPGVFERGYSSDPSVSQPESLAQQGSQYLPVGPPVGEPVAPSYPIAGSARSDRRIATSSDRPVLPPSEPGRHSGPLPPRPGYPVPYAAQPSGPTGSGPSVPHESQDDARPRIATTKPCEGAQPLAWVGSDVILAGEVMPAVDEIVARVPESERAKIPEAQKKALILKLLEDQIQTKLIYLDAQRTIPAERLPEIEKRIGEYFDKEELPKRLEKAHVGSRQELDEKLRAIGTSLERTKRAYVQRTLAMQWMQQQNDSDPDISHDAMLDYYHRHLAEFETPARARWEVMTIPIPRYTDGLEVKTRLAQLGNQVMQGIPMAEVLKSQPEGPLRCQGGLQDWITEGSLEVSSTMEQSVFGLPVGRLSEIFRDADAWHIVRVLEREEARRTPFEEAQVEVREKIRELRRQEQIQDYLARLKEQIPVRTVFDDDPDLAQLRRQSNPSMY